MVPPAGILRSRAVFQWTPRLFFSRSGVVLNLDANLRDAKAAMSKFEGFEGIGKRSKTGKAQYGVVKYILNCYFSKNNTHFTYSAMIEDVNFMKNNPHLSYNEKYQYYMKLPQKLKLHLSTGNLGFRKAARGEYEAAFQTTVKLFDVLKERNLLDKKIDIIMKDFGKGRKAFITAMNGKEGTAIRPLVNRISDATTLKFGGVKAPRPRRL
ncbi:HBL291Wp [Eremothecium sinecaudum]|uniref:Small ribosomal subunit protein uS11m n=1 Tax=Eremothecium sinecaudum TaxID=45286 RepID=A0A109UW08_9SACH|nr:HBL291Wp [Eremothecium sinecaudum]AMD18611.1 HBL291Wp [Eremothecium sinecaudum]